MYRQEPGVDGKWIGSRKWCRFHHVATAAPLKEGNCAFGILFDANNPPTCNGVANGSCANTDKTFIE
jgi:hypothetical protein